MLNMPTAECLFRRRGNSATSVHVLRGAPGRAPVSIRDVDDDHIEIGEEAVRSGQTGLHVRYILIYSTLLVAAGFGIAALASLASLVP